MVVFTISVPIGIPDNETDVRMNETGLLYSKKLKFLTIELTYLLVKLTCL